MVMTESLITLPQRSEPGLPPLHARLAVLPPPATAPAPPRARPTPHAKHAASPPRVIANTPTAGSAVNDLPQADDAPVADAEADADTAVVESEPPTVMATAPASTLDLPDPQPLRALPRRGRISYTLYAGADRFAVGRTVHTWDMQGSEYRIGSVSETSGLAAVFRNERRTYLSEGSVTRHGLQPRAFLMSRLRRGQTEVARARFDWDAHSITWGFPEEVRSAALPAGSQDFLSLLFQLALAPPAGNRIALPITTGTKFETYELEVLPEETLDTPLGMLRAVPLRQVRKPGAETIQVWLAAEYQHLPVQLRFFGRDGKPTGEQIVNEISLSEK